MTAYANTSSNVKVAQKIKKKPNIGLPKLEAWNYDACIHHDTPRANCEYRLCGNDFFAHQRVSIAWLYAIKKGLLASSPGTGKAQPVDCKVLTPSGWRRIGDLVPGDEVYEPNRRITKVKAIHPQGLQPYYNITMTDKSKTQATPDHLWKVRRGSDGPFFICTTEQLREEIKTRPMLQLPPTFVPGVGHVAREIFAIQKPNGGAWAECVCIELESEKQLYLTDDYIVTHNTNVILGLLCLLKQQNEIPRRSLIIVNTPSVKQWQAEAARFAPGLKVAAIPGGTKKSERIETYGGSWDVLIIGFHMMLKDMDLLRKINPSALLTDDVDPLLNDSTKAQPLSSKILTSDGWVSMGDITEGCYVQTPSGKPARVQKVFPHGKKPIYKVTLNDGSSTRATEDHLWDVQYRLGSSVHRNVLTTKSMSMLLADNPKITFKLPYASPGGHNKPLLIDPYVLGCLLGDGSLGSSLHFHCAEDELLQLFKDSLPSYMDVRKNAGSKISYRCVDTKSDGYDPYDDVCLLCDSPVGVVSRRLCMRHHDSLRKAGLLENCPMVYPKPNENRLLAAIKSLGIFDLRCEQKYVPPIYKFSTFENRLALLQGLMDTDGCAGTFSGYKFAVASKTLAEDVRDLVLSLGGAASSVVHTKPEVINYRSYISQVRRGDEADLGIISKHGLYTVNFNFSNGVVPFRLSRKIASSKLDSMMYDGRRIVSIEPDGEEEAQCIMINSPEHLYITDSYIVTHNCHQAITELSEDLDRVVVSNASSVGTDLIQLHSSMKPIGGKYIWGPKAAFEDNFIQKEWERIKVGTTVTTDAQGRRVSKPKYVSKSKVRGVRNSQLLRETLDPWYIRYTYDDISDVAMPEVAPVTTVWLQMHPEQRKKYQELRSGVLKMLKDGAEEVKEVNALAAFVYGGQICAGLPVLGEDDGPGKSVKFDWFCDKMRQDWSNEKVICFVRNKKAIAALKARLDKMGIGCAEVTGNKVGDERQAEITRFWEDENCRVIFCSAAGVRSLNLQCARIVCFLDIPSLNPESVHQAVGRARRAGGHDRVYPFFVMCEDTQEDKYEEVLQQRETISRWVWESEDHLLPKMSAREILKLILP